MSAHSKIIARTVTHTHRQTDMTKTLPLPQTREVKITEHDFNLDLNCKGAKYVTVLNQIRYI